MATTKTQNRFARKRRVRSKISGTQERPRMTVHRSLTQMTVQIINDDTGTTLAAASTKQLKKKCDIEGAKALGAAIAQNAKDAKIDTVVFDRNGYKYHGRIQAFADAVREAGLTI